MVTNGYQCFLQLAANLSDNLERRYQPAKLPTCQMTSFLRWKPMKRKSRQLQKWRKLQLIFQFRWIINTRFSNFPKIFLTLLRLIEFYIYVHCTGFPSKSPVKSIEYWIGKRGSICCFNKSAGNDDLLSLFTTNSCQWQPISVRSFQTTNGTNGNQWQPVVPLAKLRTYLLLGPHQSHCSEGLSSTFCHTCSSVRHYPDLSYIAVDLLCFSVIKSLSIWYAFLLVFFLRHASTSWHCSDPVSKSRLPSSFLSWSFFQSLYSLWLVLTCLSFSSGLIQGHKDQISVVTQGFSFRRCLPRSSAAVSVPVLLTWMTMASRSTSSSTSVARGVYLPPIWYNLSLGTQLLPNLFKWWP